MSFLSKIKEKFLTKSDMYNFYKDEFYKNEKRYANLDKKVDKYHNEFKKSQREYRKVSRRNAKLEKSNYNLFNTLFLYYDLKPKGILKDVQEFCVEILDFVHRVCEKHDIDYWMDYGSLLGAVRHGGFIPWDDDMDLGMLRKDFDKFLDIIDDEIKSNGLEDKLNVRKRGANAKGYIHTFLQISYRIPDENDSDNYIALAAIDIFPYDFINSYDESTTEKFGNSKIEYQEKLKSGMSRDEAVIKYLEDFDIQIDDGKYIISAVESVRGPNNSYKLYYYKKENIFPLITVNFSGKEFSAPNDCDYYLKSLYSDAYHQMPEIAHFHLRVPDLAKHENIEELFKTHLEFIRNVNENFS